MPPENSLNIAFPSSFQLIDDTGTIGPPAADYADWVKNALATVKPGDPGILRLRRPQPTAAFSPQDTVHPDYQRVQNLARVRGFEPVERGTGGRLTMFDEHALAVTLISPHPEPHIHTMRRYEIFSKAIVSALMNIGIDARVGELPNEYCPGKFSINSGGRVKLVGIAQRMNRSCVQMGAIIMVERSEKACTAIAEAYAAMGLPFDSKTYGAITELRPELNFAAVCSSVTTSIIESLAH
jgi:octanoyl-[GcvH]:protein N-octanoyltransferase